jgi:hypothetical protein
MSPEFWISRSSCSTRKKRSSGGVQPCSETRWLARPLMELTVAARMPSAGQLAAMAWNTDSGGSGVISARTNLLPVIGT